MTLFISFKTRAIRPSSCSLAHTPSKSILPIKKHHFLFPPLSHTDAPSPATKRRFMSNNLTTIGLRRTIIRLRKILRHREWSAWIIDLSRGSLEPSKLSTLTEYQSIIQQLQFYLGMKLWEWKAIQTTSSGKLLRMEHSTLKGSTNKRIVYLTCKTFSSIFWRIASRSLKSNGAHSTVSWLSLIYSFGDTLRCLSIRYSLALVSKNYTYTSRVSWPASVLR